MECKEILNQVDRYFENRISDIEKHNIKKHLERCSKCRQEYEGMSITFSILDNHYINAPDDLANKIMMKISKLEGSRKRSTKLLRNLGASFVAAGIMITLINFSDYNPVVLARGLYRSAFEINQVVTEPITKIAESLRYISDYYNNSTNK